MGGMSRFCHMGQQDAEAILRRIPRRKKFATILDAEDCARRFFDATVTPLNVGESPWEE